jgi:hypothetical protein
VSPAIEQIICVYIVVLFANFLYFVYWNDS